MDVDLDDVPFAELQTMQQRLGTKKFGKLVKQHRQLSKHETAEQTREDDPEHTSSGSEDDDQEEDIPMRGQGREDSSEDDSEISSEEDDASDEDEKKKPRDIPKRKDRNAPRELSSKRRAPSVRHTIQAPKLARRDPRFDALSGEFNQDMFEKAYGFLDDVQNKEMAEVKRALKKAKSDEEKTRLQRLLQSYKDKVKSKQHRKKQQEAKKERRKALQSAVAKGKKPFFIKKSDQRRLELANKFEVLKKSGKLQNALKKRRKDNYRKVKSMGALPMASELE